MVNQQLAKIFYQMAEYYLMDEVAFKPAVYERAGRLIEEMADDLAEIYQAGGRQALMAIDGIGQGLAEKIEEFIKTGRIKEYEKLKKQCPVDLEHLTAVEGLGPKMIKTLYKKLRVKNLADLEKAAQAGKIAKLPRFGRKIQENILRGIEFIKSGGNRMLLGSALLLARKIAQRLAELPETEKVVTAGSIRRAKETIGDIDILAVSAKPDRIMDVFCSLPEAEKILAQGATRSSVRLHNGLDADLRVIPKKSFGSAWQYFTGSKDHNIALRKIAQEKGLKLNEYGLWHNHKLIAGENEEEIYEKLGLPWLPPEIRENKGEIEIALHSAQGKPNGLPDLLDLTQVKGDLQMHSVWSDGAQTIKEIAEAAKKIGYQYIAITDHAGQLRIANAMGKKEILAQWREIDKLNKNLSGIKILKGAEVDLDDNGRPLLEENLLSQFDIVLGAVHSKIKMAKGDMTSRLVNAIKNPLIDIIAHPTNRKINQRPASQLDFEKVLAAAGEAGTVLEINAAPERLDLNDAHIRQAVEAGIRLSLGTDAHDASHLSFMELGVAQARRGWAEKKDIINTMSYGSLMAFLKKR